MMARNASIEREETGASAPKRQRGRPRSAGIDERVLAAAREIESESGYHGTSIEGIATRAGVAKSAIYRRWPNKGALLYEAVFGPAEVYPRIPDTGDLRADLIAVVRENAAALSSDRTRALLAAILADALRDETLGERLQREFFGPRSDAIVSRVELGIERGEVGTDIDTELVPAFLTGSLQYLRIVRGSTLSDDDLARIVDAILRTPASAATPREAARNPRRR